MIFDVSIVGTREFVNYPVMKMSVYQVMGLMKLSKENMNFNSGGARGADRLGERFAKSINRPIRKFIPNWDKGKGAGMKRNKEMSDASDIIIAFWDEASRGTAQMIQYSKDNGKIVFVFNFKGELIDYAPKFLDFQGKL